MKEAPDWFGCGRNITQESWDGFLAARQAYYAKQDFSPSRQPLTAGVGAGSSESAADVIGEVFARMQARLHALKGRGRFIEKSQSTNKNESNL